MSKVVTMIAIFFASLFLQVLAGPEEDLVDKILTSYLKTNIPKNVTVPNVLYPYVIDIGPFSSSLNVFFNKGHLEISSVSRTGPVSEDGGLEFTGLIDARFSFMYDLESYIPSPYSLGTATITWDVPVSMKVIMNNNKASLASSNLLRNGILAANFVPYHSTRSATVYPKDDCTFASILYQSLQRYLYKTFKNIII